MEGRGQATKQIVILVVITIAIFGGGLRSLSAVEYTDYRTFGLSNLRTIDTEPLKHTASSSVLCAFMANHHHILSLTFDLVYPVT